MEAPDKSGTEAPDTSGIIERLRSIEEDLRDLAYDRLRQGLESGSTLAEERRLHKARQAIEKAIRILDPSEHLVH